MKMAMNKNIMVLAVGLVIALASGLAGGYASLVAGVGMVVAGVAAVDLIGSKV